MTFFGKYALFLKRERATLSFLLSLSMHRCSSSTLSTHEKIVEKDLSRKSNDSQIEFVRIATAKDASTRARSDAIEERREKQTLHPVANSIQSNPMMIRIVSFERRLTNRLTHNGHFSRIHRLRTLALCCAERVCTVGSHFPVIISVLTSEPDKRAM